MNSFLGSVPYSPSMSITGVTYNGSDFYGYEGYGMPAMKLDPSTIPENIKASAMRAYSLVQPSTTSAAPSTASVQTEYKGGKAALCILGIPLVAYAITRNLAVSALSLPAAYLVFKAYTDRAFK